jgi:histidinol-phosphatase (PHP family)
MVWFSYHGGHSGEFCRHAKGRLDEVVAAAAERGFSTYGLSEHCPRWHEAHLYREELGLGVDELTRSFAGYVRAALELRDRYAPRLELLVGFETEALPVDTWPERMQQIRADGPFDYIVGSVHSVGEIWVDLDPETTARARESCGGDLALHLAYFQRLTELVLTLRPEIVGHVDLVRRFEGHSFEFSPRALSGAERVLEAALSVGAALEVNAAPARRGFGPVYPGPQILRRACELGVPVTLGDDSHGPDAVGVGLDESLRAIERAGYDDGSLRTHRYCSSCPPR